jgi:hypothetical protein
MPAFLEKKLKSEYGQNSATPYKVMNKLGYMKGNKETPLGAAAQAKHNAKVAKLGTKAKKFKQPSVKLSSLIKGM